MSGLETAAQPTIDPEDEKELEEVEEQAEAGEDEPGDEAIGEGDEATNEPAEPAAATEVTPAESADAEAKPTEPKSNEMKVLIAIDGENIMVGIKTPDTDPIFTKVEGGLAAALQRVPELIEDAKAKWATSPRNPKANLPEPPTPVTPARTTSVAAPSKPQQPSFF